MEYAVIQLVKIHADPSSAGWIRDDDHSPVHHCLGFFMGDITLRDIACWTVLHLLPQGNGYIVRGVQGKWFCIGLELYGNTVALKGI